MSEFKDPFDVIEDSHTLQEVEQKLKLIKKSDIFPTDDATDRKKIYRSLSKKYHPDMSNNLAKDVKKKVFQCLSIAYAKPALDETGSSADTSPPYDGPSYSDDKTPMENIYSFCHELKILPMAYDNFFDLYLEKITNVGKEYDVNVEKIKNKLLTEKIEKIYNLFKGSWRSQMFDGNNGCMSKIIDIEKKYGINADETKNKILNEAVEDIYKNFESASQVFGRKENTYLSDYIKKITDIEEKYNIDYSSFKNKALEFLNAA